MQSDFYTHKDTGIVMHSEGASPLPGAMHINEFLGRIGLNVDREEVPVYGCEGVMYSFVLEGERINVKTGKFYPGAIDETGRLSLDRAANGYFVMYEKMRQLSERDDHRNMKISVKLMIPVQIPNSVVGMRDE